MFRIQEILGLFAKAHSLMGEELEAVKLTGELECSLLQKILVNYDELEAAKNTKP